MLIGAGFAWIHLTSSGHVALAAIMVQISIVLLAGMWTSGWAVVAETRILILATGGLALIHHRAERRFVWVKALFIAAFAGLPLTAGFDSRVGLYKSWLDDGRGLLVLVMALLHVSVIAALLRPFWLDGNVSDHKSETSLEKIRLGAGLGIGMVGLLSFARTPLGDVSILTWGAILLPVIFGVIISWQAERVREAHLGLRRALHFELPMTRINRLWANAFSIFKDILRESTATLEGEGGMLWLLLLLVVFWLARSA
jgi:hypothetical protein